MHGHLNVKNVTDIVVYFLPIYQFAINQVQRIVVQRIAFNVRVSVILFL